MPLLMAPMERIGRLSSLFNMNLEIIIRGPSSSVAKEGTYLQSFCSFQVMTRENLVSITIVLQPENTFLWFVSISHKIDPRYHLLYISHVIASPSFIALQDASDSYR